MAVANTTITRLTRKRAGEVEDYNIGFTLDSGDTFASTAVISTITSGHGVTVASTGASNVVITATSGQTSGELYYFSLEIATTGGRRHVRQLLLPVGQ